MNLAGRHGREPAMPPKVEAARWRRRRVRAARCSLNGEAAFLPLVEAECTPIYGGGVGQ